MTTLLYMHPSSLEHDTGPGHPESSARMRAIMAALEREERKGALVGVERREPPRATRTQLERVHTARYIDAVLRAEPASGHVRLDPDTVMSPGSGEAALSAAGAAVAAVDAVIGGDRYAAVDSVVFNGVVDAVDPVTHRTIRPCLISLRTTPQQFVALEIGKLDPAACAHQLAAEVSARPEQLQPVEPILDFSEVDPHRIRRRRR